MQMTIYQLTDRPRRGRAVQQRGDRVVATVPAWSAELGAHSPSVEYLAPAGPAGNGRSALFATARRASPAWWAARDHISPYGNSCGTTVLFIWNLRSRSC